nr:Down syndrome cell adhesion molecule-like protein Dscam2 [Drosophila bipectinata]
MVDALGPQQLLITWRAPIRDTWNGEILGYTIKYQRNGFITGFRNYTKVNRLPPDGFNNFRLSGLDKYTQYEITISAYNIKGDGPPSDIVLGHTLEDAPSASPRSVSCNALGSQNIQLFWQPPLKEFCNGIIQGYKIFYEPRLLENQLTARETKVSSALTTVLHGLQPFTNYTIQVLAFTRAGEGNLSNSVSCITEEAVPDAPERVKSIVSSESSVIISWMPPRRPNGLIIKYDVYIRVLEKGKELKILKEILPSQQLYYEVKGVIKKETYEAWVTSSTKVGQGPSTPVIKFIANNVVPAAIISFSQVLRQGWTVDLHFPCIFVGSPKAAVKWNVVNNQSKKHIQMEISKNNTLSLRNIQRAHEGNYTCMVKNLFGSDQITYQLFVQVPPSTPIVSITSIEKKSISVQWKVDDIGGSFIKGFTLKYKREIGLWKELLLDARLNSVVIENLQCGTPYQITVSSYNRIGTSPSSEIKTIKTKGEKPVAPHDDILIRLNTTSISLELSSWQDGGCAISHFSIEFKRNEPSNRWIIVSNKVESHSRYLIGDLEAGTAYKLRVTAYNNAGSTKEELCFTTLNINELYKEKDLVKTIISDSQLIAVIVTSIFGIFLALAGALICIKKYSRDTTLDDSKITDGLNMETSTQSCDHFYGTLRKSYRNNEPKSAFKHSISPHNREGIKPYAKFDLHDNENVFQNNSQGQIRKILNIQPSSCIANSPLYSAEIKLDSSLTHVNDITTSLRNVQLNRKYNHINTDKENNISSKLSKSDSEEYDILNSDGEQCDEFPVKSKFFSPQNVAVDNATWTTPIMRKSSAT